MIRLLILMALIGLYSCRQEKPTPKQTLGETKMNRCIMLYEDHRFHDASTNFANQIFSDNPGDWTCVLEGKPVIQGKVVSPEGETVSYQNSRILIQFEDGKRFSDKWFMSYMAGDKSQSRRDLEVFSNWMEDNFPGMNLNFENRLEADSNLQEARRYYQAHFPNKDIKERLARSTLVNIAAENSFAKRIKSGDKNLIRVGSGHRRISILLRARGFSLEEFFFPSDSDTEMMSAMIVATEYITCPEGAFQKF